MPHDLILRFQNNAFFDTIRNLQNELIAIARPKQKILITLTGQGRSVNL